MKWTKPRCDPLGLSKLDHRENLNLFERLVMGPVEAGEDYVDKIPTGVALHMLNLAKQAPRKPGKEPDSRRMRYAKNMAVAYARRRRDSFESSGTKKTDNAWQAAEDAEAWMRQYLARRNLPPDWQLSAATIYDQMGRKTPRAPQKKTRT